MSQSLLPEDESPKPVMVSRDDEELVQFNIRIKRKTYNSFIKIVKEKYPNLHGGLKAEGEEALLAWIRKHTHAQLDSTKMNPSFPHVHKFMDDIMKVLRLEYDVGLQVDTDTLREAIMKARGVRDPRSVNKWIKQLLVEKKIKILRPNIYEVV